MWATVGMVLKNVGILKFARKKGLKIIGGVILGLIILVISPLLVILALFGSYERSSPELFGDAVASHLNNEQYENMELIGDTMTEIETKMNEASYTEADIEDAHLIYSTTLYTYSSEENFVDRFVACFEDNDTDEDLINKVNEEFGTDIDIQEFRDILGR